MNAYSFDSITGFYLGETPCQRDPLAGGFLLPAAATFTKPPACGVNQIQKWDGKKWQIVTIEQLEDGEAQAVES